MDEDDLEYYRGRAITERRMAAEASRAEVAEIHLELAQQYEALVKDKRLRPILSIVTSKGMESDGIG